MSEEQQSVSEASICEIVGCSSPATTTRWIIDENRQLDVCWTHAEGEPTQKPTSSP
jgi:hypothetical protein